MAVVLKKLVNGYFWLFHDLRDQRVDDYFLLSSVAYPLGLCLSYLYLIRVLLPKFMKNRPPYDIKNILLIFNAGQVLINGYLSYLGIKLTFQIDNIFCVPVNHPNITDGSVVLSYVYFLVKVSDFCDTIFFILRKKDNQATFLHVYHHFGMVLGTWMGVRFLPGGQSMLFGLPNVIVHTFMYAYYLLTAWKPEYAKNVFLKRQITHLQFVQFFFIVVIFGQLLFTDCDYPKIASFFAVGQTSFMMILFGNFYRKMYLTKKRTS